MSTPKSDNYLSELRKVIWPIERYENKKFLPMAFMMFCILLNYSTLRSIKDGFVVTDIGAEAISFLKTYIVLPSAVIAMVIYVKLCDILKQENVFYIITSFFLGYFALFAFVLYPYPDLVHPDPETIESWSLAYPNFKWFIRIVGKWSFASFYTMAELWGTMMLSLLFWQFANQITKTDEAKRFYSMFGLLANLALPVTSVIIGYCLHEKTQIVYWLSSLIPDKSSNYSSNFNYALKQGTERYQVDFISPVQIIKPGENFSIKSRIFAGAKKVDLLDKYEKQYDIKLFDRAIDFGWFYIITKPVFYAMNFFYGYVGNFGVSILIVTVIIKLLMFTLANRSYRSMKKMKNLQPEIDRIKNLYSDDKARLNQEIMALYKKEKVNPVAGCLPILVQIPVFFSIYKVLYVTIEMRQAPFYGWIKDLSAPDPTTIFNLFGLLPFSPPSFLMIGAWPILMAITMFLQQKMSPEPADPMQAQVMKFMPLIFLFMFSSFPVGLLIYWSWNNILSIIQQYYINKFN